MPDPRGEIWYDRGQNGNVVFAFAATDLNGLKHLNVLNDS